jgi:hypothetical protein
MFTLVSRPNPPISFLKKKREKVYSKQNNFELKKTKSNDDIISEKIFRRQHIELILISRPNSSDSRSSSWTPMYYIIFFRLFCYLII